MVKGVTKITWLPRTTFHVLPFTGVEISAVPKWFTYSLIGLGVHVLASHWR